jgi:Holliday junction resolvase RusA-like endonuclease
MWGYFRNFTLAKIINSMDYREDTFIVNPMGAPRMTQRDKWKKRPIVERYFAYRDAVRLQGNLCNYELTGVIEIEFHIEAPNVKEKERTLYEGVPHTSKPDIDNLIKAFLDCFGEDKTVHTIKAIKLWTTGKGRIVTRSPQV